LKIDLNADMGESYGRWTLGDDPALMPYLTSANIACGFHGGDPHVMRKTVALALAHGVGVGAHVAFPDLIGFGRRRLAATPEEIQDYANKLARYIATKEQHAEIAKSEIRILWGDYFKPEHAQAHPQLHETVFKAMKTASKARQEINLQAAEDLLKVTNDIAEIFWKTKNIPTVRAKAPYPTERETVYPKLG